MAKNTDFTKVTVSYSEAVTAACVAINAGFVPILMAEPGTGKTTLRHDIRKTLGLEGDILVKPSMHDSVDFTGVPYIVDGLTYFAPNGLFLPGKDAPKTGLLTIDEAGDAVVSVQNVMCAMMLERKVGSAIIPDGWVLYATSNRVEDRSGANRFVSKLINRMVFLNLAYGLPDFNRFAMMMDYDPQVMAFPNFAPQYLNTFDPKLDGEPFATPRTWEVVNTVVKQAKGDIGAPGVFPVVAGLIGGGLAAAFRAFCNMTKRAPDPAHVYLNPTGTPVPDEKELLYVLYSGIIKSMQAKNIPAVRTYVDRVPSKELEAFMLKSLCESRMKDMLKPGHNGEFSRWTTERAALLR